MPGRQVPRFWWLATVLLLIMAALQFTTVRRESQTMDESRQLLSGYTYLLTGHFTVAIEHPPLLKLLWAVPVSLLHPDPPPDIEDGKASADFLYRNRVPADSMLLAGRASAIAVSLLLGLAIAFWARRHFGDFPALLAVFLYAADPNFLANGRYMKNDVGVALAIFAATMLWGAYLLNPTRARLWLSGLAVGLALTTKNSAVILGPVMLLLYWIHGWQQRRRFSAGECLRCVRTIGAAGGIAFFVIFAVYRFEVEPAGASSVFSTFFPPWLGRVPVPALAYFRGLGSIGLRQVGPTIELGYLLGERSSTGWWYMSPVALAVKTPLADLLLFLLVLCMAAPRLRTLRLRELSFRWYLLILPAACYFLAALLSHANAGERHLLPLYPFFFVFTGAVLMAEPLPRWRWMATAAAGVVLIAETASIHPHYLAFFNALAGGPVGGREFLVDSNLDWGQDVKYLKEYLDAHRIPEVCISYFGFADLDYYEIAHRELPAIPNAEVADQLNCVAAISVTHLAVFREKYAGLEQLPPDARIGYSIYLYDLRKPAP